MRNPLGYVQVVGERGTIERDSITCGHCNWIVMVKPGTGATVYYIPQMEGPPLEEPGAMCRVCMRPVCLRCHDDGRCMPLMKRIEEMEKVGKMVVRG